MSVHLVGGGRDLAVAPRVYGRFVEEAIRRAGSRGRDVPVVAVVIVAEAADLEPGVAWFRQAIDGCGPAVVDAATAGEGPSDRLRLGDGSSPTDDWFAGLDGLLVGGGLTPAYHRVLQPHAESIRRAVADGLPYAGFSAGAMIAPAKALLGGWRLGPTAVTHADNAEDLDQVTVVDGLGLTSATVEVHTAQWGTLSRLVAVVGEAVTERGIAVDENTVVIIDPATDSLDRRAVQVVGAGQAWAVERSAGVVRVDRWPAG